jgi:hypothetical protein
MCLRLSFEGLDIVVQLKGENHVKKLKRLAEELSLRIASYEEVAGIAFHGAQDS